MDIAGKVILVTGASTGIGLETARLLARSGARLALNARSKDKLAALSRELPGSEVFPADMAVEQEARQLIREVHQRMGRLDVLVNNAGRGMSGPLETLPVNEYRDLIELNLMGPLVAMQEVVPMMRRQGGGAIVNISSGTTLMYAPGLSGYSATKRALNGLTLTARNELAKDNIAVSVVYPYITDSDFYKNLISAGPSRSVSDFAAGRPPADSSTYVAELIQAVIVSGDAEIYAHDWMKNAMR